MSDIDFETVWMVMTNRFALGSHSLHGPKHWHRVESNGVMLSRLNSADETVVRLFAAIHDVLRENEGYDPEHGRRAAGLAKESLDEMFYMSEARFALLHYALSFHNDGTVTDDLTIGTCWDADRMDLPRVGITPDPKMMNTVHGKQFARLGPDGFRELYLTDNPDEWQDNQWRRSNETN